MIFLPHGRMVPGRDTSSLRIANFTPQLFLMLASRTSTAARQSARIARTFATVSDTAGVKVAAVDNGQPTAAVTFLVKAGARFETKAGVAHGLKNFAYKVRCVECVKSRF